jgi:cytoskeletal protein RodZ
VGAFGEKLRKQREQRGIGLDAISNTTKISTRMLRALEEEHFDQLPGGVFNKGFVRAYARQIGLDEEEAVSDYLAALRESQIQAQKILPDFRTPGAKPSSIAAPDPRHHVPSGGELSRDDGKNNGSHDFRGADRRKQGRRNDDRRNVDHGNDDRRSADHSRQDSPLPDSAVHALAEHSSQSADEPATSTRIPRNLLAAALLLATVGLAVWNSHRHRESASKAAASSTQSPSLVSALPLPAIQPSAPAASLKAAQTSPTATAPSLGTSSGAAPSPSTKASMTSFATKPAPNPSAANPPMARTTTTDTAAAKPPSTFTLLIRAEKTTWVSIIADGKPVAHETLIAPAHTSVRATREIVVKAGNAAGISFLLNGREIPASGNEGEVKTYTFDASGSPAVPQIQPPTTNR